jgi:chromosome segregation ATPase
MRAHGGASRTRCEICDVPQGKRHLAWCEHFKQRGGARVPGMTVAEARPFLSNQVIATEYPVVSEEEARQERLCLLKAQIAACQSARSIEQKSIKTLERKVDALKNEYERALAFVAKNDAKNDAKNSEVESAHRELLTATAEHREKMDELQAKDEDLTTAIEKNKRLLKSCEINEEQILAESKKFIEDIEALRSREASARTDYLTACTQRDEAAASRNKAMQKMREDEAAAARSASRESPTRSARSSGGWSNLSKNSAWKASMRNSGFMV